MINLGDKVTLENPLEQTTVLFFISSFCSKCHYNRNLLNQYIEDKYIREVNIANHSIFMEQIRPRMAPTLVIVNPQGIVLFLHEGVLTDALVPSLVNLL